MSYIIKNSRDKVSVGSRRLLQITPSKAGSVCVYISPSLEDSPFSHFHSSSGETEPTS